MQGEQLVNSTGCPELGAEFGMNKSSSEEASDRAIKKSFVDTLFLQSETLVTGWISQSFCCLFCLADRGRIEYLYLIVVLTVILAARLWDIRNYNSRMQGRMLSQLTDSNLRYWEIRYMFGSGATASGLALISSFTLYTAPISASALAAVGLSIGTMISVVGKNFGSKANIDLLVGITCLSMFASFALNAIHTMNWMLLALSILLVPLGLITRQMAGRVRGILRESLENLAKAEVLQRLFQAALLYMPSGLIMINDKDHVTLMNNKAARMFGIRDTATVTNSETPLNRMIAYGVFNGDFSKQDARTLKNTLSDLSMGKTPDSTIQIGDNHIKLSINRLPKKDARGDDTLGGAVIICEDVTARVESDRRVRYLANYDSLSNLPVRRHMKELVNAAVKQMGDNELIAIAIFDVDKFKHINDHMGHAMGDEAIRKVGEQLNSIKHPNFLKGRYGGDEFVLAFHGLKDDQTVSELLDSVFTTICKNYEVTQDVEGKNGVWHKTYKTLEIRCSGGVVVRSKKDFDLDDALNKADIALLEAKREPLKFWSRFDEKMETEHRKAERLKDDFKLALRNGEVRAFYQPMYTPDGKQIKAAEALARWTHSELGPISPAVFVPLAEQHGLVGDLTKAILNRACQDCAAWPEKIGVSVNLSGIDLANREIVQTVEQALSASKLDPRRLQIEVTESVFLKDREKAASILHHLRGYGVKIAIDDFGTGYSNLAYLKQLPLDKLKIDRSFVTRIDEDDQAAHLFHALVMFSKSLRFEVVVEGVETAEQMEVIRKSDVDLIQGFVFGKPMENSDLLARMASMAPKSQRKTNVVALRDIA
jgi:diguanylate cyclase (GGDEF)-like protein